MTPYPMKIIQIEVEDILYLNVQVRRDGSYFYQVGVSSTVNTQHAYQGQIDANDENPRKQIEVLAGALAEKSIELHGSGNDPSDVAHLAAESYDRLVSELEKARRAHKRAASVRAAAGLN